MFFNLITESESLKTKGCAVTYTDSSSCPDACALKGWLDEDGKWRSGGCYAETGKVNLHWMALDDGYRGSARQAKAYTFGAFLAGIRALPSDRRLRLNVAGDLPGDNNAIDRAQLAQLARASSAGGRIAWTYTHKPILEGSGGASVWRAGQNIIAIREAIAAGLAINASADNLSEADEKAELGFPVAVVMPESAKAEPIGISTPGGRKVVVCPATLDDSHRVTCNNCGGSKLPLCARIDRDYVIGFPAHGSARKSASKVASSYRPAGSMLAMAQ